MIDKSEMIRIWNNEPVGYLKRNFCGVKSKTLKKYSVNFKFWEKIMKYEKSFIVYAKDANKASNSIRFSEEYLNWQREINKIDENSKHMIITNETNLV